MGPLSTRGSSYMSRIATVSPKQMFLQHLGPVMGLFGPPKFPRYLENGLLYDNEKGQKWIEIVFFQQRF